MKSDTLLILYAAKIDGKYLVRGKLTDDLASADITVNPAKIRRAITTYATKHPNKVPDLLKLHCTKSEVVAERNRVLCSIASKKEQQRKQQESYRQWKITTLTNNVAKAKQELTLLQQELQDETDKS